MLLPLETYSNIETEDYVPHKEISQVFFKPITKEFIDGHKIIYMVLSDKGQALAFFGSIPECQYYAIRNDFAYQLAH